MQNENARMFILAGLPYAGKTTLTRELERRFGFVSISVDNVIDKKGFDTERMTQGEWDTAYTQAYDELNDHLVHNRTVIVDIGNLKRSERDTARAISMHHGVKSRLIYINTPKDVIWERWNQNEVTRQRGQLSRELLQQAFAMWEEPTPDENPILYNQTMNLEGWIRTNIEGSSSGIEQK